MSHESDERLTPGEPEAAEESPRRRSRLDLILAVTAVVLLVGIFAGAYFVVQASQQQQPQSMEDAQIQQLQQQIKQSPKSPNAYLALAGAYYKVKAYDKALQALSDLQSTHPTGTVLAESVYAQAKIAEVQGNPEAAITGYQRSIAVTDTPDARWALGLLYLDRKQYGDATKSLERYVALVPSDADGFVRLGEAYEGIGARAKALAAYEKAKAFVPDNKAAAAAINRLKGQK